MTKRHFKDVFWYFCAVWVKMTNNGCNVKKKSFEAEQWSFLFEIQRWFKFGALIGYWCDFYVNAT